MTGDEAPQAQGRTHERWENIDWSQITLDAPKTIRSYDVERCACTTPWQHYP